jgi:hypothetical protein
MFVRITTPDSKSKLLNVSHIRTLRGDKFIVDTENGQVDEYDPELYEAQDGDEPIEELSENQVLVVGTVIETSTEGVNIYAMEPEHVLTAAIVQLRPLVFSVAN